MVTALEILARLNKLNQSSTSSQGGFKVPYHAFHLPELVDHIDISMDYIKWVMEDVAHRVTPACSLNIKPVLLNSEQSINS